MRFAVVGSGGVGGYFGGRLAQSGHEVTFVARGAHLAAMQLRGLEVRSIEGDFRISPVRATDDLNALDPVDVILLAVKTWQVEELAARLSPLLASDGAVLTLQNGVEAPEEVSRACGPARVLAGVCRLMSYVAEPGVICHAGVSPRVELGEWAGGPSDRARSVQEALNKCQGVSAVLSPDIRTALWEKFLFIAPFSAVGAVTGKPAGKWRDVPETRALLRAAMNEVVEVAAALGIGLGEGAVDRTLGFADRLQPDATSSMQRDLLEGKPSELEAQTGAIVRLAAKAGVAVPANAFLYAALLPSERAARGR